MDISRNAQRGFHVIELIVIVVIVLVMGLIAWRMLSGSVNKSDSSSANRSTDSSRIQWSWNGGAWAASGVAPTCPEPLSFATPPTDLSKAVALLYPGQERGHNYKPHGGFIMNQSTNGDVTVRAIMDGYVTSGARYIEQGELQHMFTITNNCGIAYRYDHLAVLSPVFMTLANSLPAAKENDSRTTDFTNPVKITSGDTIATKVGFKTTSNYSFDLGVYDYRKRNRAADNTAYTGKHQNELSQAAYALCWLDMFGESNTTLLRNLPAGDAAMGKTSDYCN